MLKLTVIIDKSDSYTSFQRDNVLKEWGVDNANTEILDSFARVGEEDIFGDSLVSIINVNNLEQWKKMVLDIEKSYTNDELDYKVRNGLIITSNLARNSTKKFEELVKKWGGKVIVSKESSKDKTNVAEQMLSVLSLSSETQKFLVEYAADDYDSLIPVIQSLSDIPKSQQKKVSIEDLIIRLPRPPGSIPPWEIEKPLFAGDADKTIQIYRRIINHSHYLVVLSILKNKIILTWRLSALLDNNPRTNEAQAAAALGVPKNYPFKIAFTNAKKIGFQKMSDVLCIIVDTEAKVKGGSSASSSVIMEIALMKILGKLK